jgi:hypothetical protein
MMHSFSHTKHPTPHIGALTKTQVQRGTHCPAGTEQSTGALLQQNPLHDSVNA